MLDRDASMYVSHIYICDNCWARNVRNDPFAHTIDETHILIHQQEDQASER